MNSFSHLKKQPLVEILELEDFYSYMQRKCTEDYCRRLSWFDYMTKNDIDRVDFTSNKVEALHHSLSSYLRPSLGDKRAKFCRVLKHTRDFLIVLYNDHERVIRGDVTSSVRPQTEKNVKKTKFLKNFVHTVQKRISARKNITTDAALGAFCKILSKNY